MKTDEIKSSLHARRLTRHAETEYRDHVQQCATCETSHRPCSMGAQLREARNRFRSVYRSLRNEE